MDVADTPDPLDIEGVFEPENLDVRRLPTGSRLGDEHDSAEVGASIIWFATTAAEKEGV